MKDFFNALRMDLWRGLRSPLFYLSILAFTLLHFAGTWQEMTLVGETSSVLYLYHADEFMTADILFGALPFATAFCMEWRYRYTRYAIPRCSLGAYTWSKIIAGALIGGLAVAFGYLLFWGGLSLRYPLVDPANSMFDSYAKDCTFGFLLTEGHPIAFFATLLTDHALTAMICAAVATAITGFIPNLFVALSCPLIFYYININGFTNKWLNMLDVLYRFGPSYGSPLATFLYRWGYTGAWIAMFGALFYFGVKRRVLHG